jgi:PHS family inorganic phosphate transporter-like MFS transporter
MFSKAFISALGNFSVQYNLACLSIAIAFMTYTDSSVSAYSPEPSWGKYTILGSVFSGAAIGMVIMGYIGDLLGNRAGMLLTLSFVVFGSLASALGTWGSPDILYGALAFFRFLLGIGVGGIYPCAAKIASEGSANKGHEGGEDIDDVRKKVAQAFFWQAPGSATPYVVSWLILAIMTGEQTNSLTNIEFRLLLGLGAIPASIVWYATYLSSNTAPAETPSSVEDGVADAETDAEDASLVGSKKIERNEVPSPWVVIQETPVYGKYLFGTSFTWLLYDVSFYGTNIFTPTIIASIFGKAESLHDLCWQSLVVSAMAIPACLLAIYMIRPMGGRWLNAIGFIANGLCFAAMGLAYQYNLSSNVLFAVFCFLTFSLNWGPNVATYVTPAEAFPSNIRGTFHGISAASGKVGAVIGTFMFTPVSQAYGNAGVMWVQVVLSIIGAVVAYHFLPKMQVKASADGDDDPKGSAGGLEKRLLA